MKIGHKIDVNGFLLEDVIEGGVPDVTTLCPDGLFNPRWNGTAWVEGLTQAEIDALKNAPVPPTLEEQVKQLQGIINAMMMG